MFSIFLFYLNMLDVSIPLIFLDLFLLFFPYNFLLFLLQYYYFFHNIFYVFQD